MLEEKKIIELDDEELNEVSGGTDTPTSPCPFGRMKYVPLSCKLCLYAPKSSTDPNTRCGLGYPKGSSLDGSVTPV